MTDPENAQPPVDEEADATDDEASQGANEGPRKTLNGMGADLRLPRPRASTVHSVGPATTREDSEADNESEQNDSSEEPERFDLDGTGGGWKSVPLTELSIPSPAEAKAKKSPSPPEEPEEFEEFEAEATQMADDLVISSEVDDAGEFEDEATQIGIPEEFIEADAQVHEARLGIANTAAVEPITDQAIEEVRRAESDFKEEAPLPQPIKSDDPAPTPSTQDPVEEFEDQKTEVLNSPFESEPAVAKLHALEGPVAGQEFFVTQLRNTIGRGEGNSIMVADPAMSRQHMEVVKNPDDSYTLRDLQSVNGTGLNGTRIRECDLFHGDRVEAGKTVFQFLVRGKAQQAQGGRHLIPAASATMSGGFPAMDPRPAVPPAQQSPDQLAKLSTIVTVVAGIISLILVIGIGFLLIEGGLPGAGGDAPPESASKLYLEAVESVKNRDWAEAETKFLRAKKLDEGLSIDAQMDRIKKEKAAKAAYDSLLQNYKAGEYDRVAEFAAKIPSESVYHAEATELASKREKFAVDAVYAKAQAAATREDFEEALELVDEVLEETPTHRGALALRDRIEDEMAERKQVEAEERDAVAQKRPAKRQRSAFDIDLDNPPPRAKKSSSKSRIINFTRGYRLYRSKKFDEAADFFAEVGRERSGPGARRASRTAEDIRSFSKNYTSGKRAYAAKNWSAARSPLRSAYRSDASISGGRGYHRDEIAKMLAETEANLGLNALSSKKYADARKRLESARNYDSSASDVRKLDSRLNAEAKTLYIKAANLRKKDPRVAAELCRDIMAMTSSSDATHKKAQSLLKEL